MTSELRVDNLKGSTTGGSINVLGEGTSATTNLQQGLGKSWCNFDGTAGSVSFADSFNMSGLTDNATGDFTVTFANDMANATYANAIASTFFNHVKDATGAVATGSHMSNGHVFQSISVYTTSGAKIICTNDTGGSAVDSGDLSVQTTGALA